MDRSRDFVEEGKGVTSFPLDSSRLDLFLSVLTFPGRKGISMGFSHWFKLNADCTSSAALGTALEVQLQPGQQATARGRERSNSP